MITDDDAKLYVAANVQSLLEKQGHTVYWLMKTTRDLPNRIYPVVRGETIPTAGLLCRIATALGVTADDLMARPPKKNLEKILHQLVKSA